MFWCGSTSVPNFRALAAQNRSGQVVEYWLIWRHFLNFRRIDPKMQEFPLNWWSIFLTPPHFRIISAILRICLQNCQYSTARHDRFWVARALKFGPLVELGQKITWFKFQSARINIASVRRPLVQTSFFQSLKLTFLAVYLSYRDD